MRPMGWASRKTLAKRWKAVREVEDATLDWEAIRRQYGGDSRRRLVSFVGRGGNVLLLLLRLPLLMLVLAIGVVGI